MRTFTILLLSICWICTQQAKAQCDTEFFCNPPTITCVAPATFGCQLTGNGPFSFLWLDPEGNPISTDSIITVSSPGLYTLQATDVLACTESTIVPIFEDNVPLDCSISMSGISCEDSNITLSVDCQGLGVAAYSWSAQGIGSGTEQTFDVNTSGEYCVTVTDFNGCEWSDCVDVTISPAISVEIIEEIRPRCEEDDSGWLRTVVSGGTPPYNYQWSNGSTATQIVDIFPGIYSLTITDANGCQLVVDTELEPTLFADAGEDQTLYCEDTTELRSNNFSKISHTIIDPDFNNVLDASTFQELPFEILNGYIGQSISSPDTPVDPDATHFYIGSVDAQQEESVCVPVTVENFQNILSFNFDLRYDPSYLQFDGVNDIVADFDGLTITTSLDNPDIPPGVLRVLALQPNFNGVSLQDASTLFSLCFTVIDNTQNLLFEWSGPDNFSSTLLNPVVNESGIYTFRVTDTSIPNCWVEDSVMVEFVDSLIVDIGADTIVYCENDTYTLNVSVQGDTGFPNFYQWSTGETTPEIQIAPNSGDKYYVTVSTQTQDGGCVGVDSVVMQSTPAFVIDDLPPFITACEGDFATLSPLVSGGTPPYTYSWNGGIDAPSISVNVSGVLTLTVADAAGCVKEQEVITEFLPAPIISFPGDYGICAGQQITLEPTVNGANFNFEYSWSNGDFGPTTVVNPLVTTTYSVTVFDGTTSCFAEQEVTVVVNDLQYNATVQDCDLNGTPTDPSDDFYYFDMTVAGSNGSVWTGLVNGEFATGFYGVPQIFGPFLVADGNVPIQLIDQDNPACNISDEIAPPACDIGCGITAEVLELVCFDNDTPADTTDDYYAAFILVEGSGTTWTSSVSGQVAPFNVPVFLGVEFSPGTDVDNIIIYDSDSNGCSTTLSFDSPDCTPPPCEISAAYTILSCDDNGTPLNSDDDVYEIEFLVENPVSQSSIYTYSINGAPTSEGTYTEPEVVTVSLPTGSNFVEFTDELNTDCQFLLEIPTLGCSDPCEVTDIVITATATEPYCYGLSNACVELDVSGGNPPYSYDWSNGMNTQEICDLPAGIYEVTITDVFGCTATASFTIDEPDELLVQIIEVQAPTCETSSDGQLTAVVAGGTPPYIYLWSNGMNTQTATGLSVGTITLTVLDANDCEASTDYILDPTTIADAGPDAVTATCAAASITLDASNSTMGPNITYEWQLPDGSFESGITINATLPGTYQLTVSNTTVPSCFSYDEIEVSFTDNLLVDIVGPDTIYYCEGTDITLVSDVQGGTGQYEYAWSTAETTPNITVTPLSGFWYHLTVTDQNGCMGIDSVLLLGHPILIVDLPSNLNACEGELITLTPGIIGGPQLNYLWNTGATTASITVNMTGTYSVTVTDFNGCSGEAATGVTLHPNPVINFPGEYDICLGETITLTPDIQTSVGTAAYEWSNGATTQSITVSPPQTTTYFLTVTDVLGCTGEESVTVNVNVLSVDISNIICDVNGTPTDPSDDWYTFDVLVNGGPSDTWDAEIDGVPVISGSYGQLVTLGPIPVVNDVSLLIDDSENQVCSFSQVITPPICDVECEMEVNILDVLCNDNGTPADQTDDFYTVSVEVTTSFPGVNGWINNFGQTGNYDEPTFISTTFIPGSDASLTFTDVDDSVCNTSVNVPSPDCFPDPCEGVDIQVNVVTTDVACFGEADGCIELDVTGGTPPYLFEWSTGENAQNLCNLPAGVFSVTIVDANGCSTESSFAITEPAPLTLTIIEIQAPTCETTSDGILDVIVTGGTAPYTYLWATGNTTTPHTGLAPGVYSITVVDANNCFAVDDYELLPATIADAGPDMELTCLGASVTLDGSGSAMGPNIIYEWQTPDGNIISGPDEISPTVNMPGIYYLTVTNTDVPDCYSYDEVVVTSGILDVSVGYNLASCDSADLYFTPPIVNFDGTWTLPDNTTVPIEPGFTGTTQTGMHYLSLLDVTTGCLYEDSVFVNIDPTSCVTVKGRVVMDTIQDCIPIADEPGLSNWLIVIEGGGEVFYAVTQADGSYEQMVPAGIYEVYPLLPSSLWLSCEDSYTVELETPGEMAMQDIPVYEQEPCPELSVDFSMPLLRRCWTRTLFIQYCNDGTAVAEDAYIEVTLDEQFTFIIADAPIIDQDGNTFTFDIGDVDINECDILTVFFSVSCDAIVGESLCAEAKIFPNAPCESPNPLWSGANLEVTADCDEEEEEVRFKVSNTGLFGMNAYSSSIVIEDGVMLMVIPDSIHLDAGEFHDFVFPANGSTYRFETEQAPYHPRVSQPMAVVEGCGENAQGGISTGFVNQFSMNDDDEFFDVECREVVGSYDPNDKHGFPRGYGDEHLIYPGIDLEYLINFQNTGNDTAFLVVIKDTLSEHLDITSIRPGAASHPYTWDIDDGNTLVFTFENILLPDSTTNLEGSQGFIEYKISQRADLPLGTIIENRAGIYFDINEPIITNTTYHKLGEDFIKIITTTEPEVHQNVSINIVPNPIRQEAQFILSGWPEGESQFELFDHMGRGIMHQTFNGSTFIFRRGTLADGMYYFKIFDRSGVQLSGQLMLAE